MNMNHKVSLPLPSVVLDQKQTVRMRYTRNLAILYQSDSISSVNTYI